MNIYTALQIGDYHLNYCEDYFFTGNIGNDTLLCAVMDGCTMGIDSYFAATLTGKLLRRIAKEKNYKAFYHTEPLHADLDSCLRSVMNQLFKELNTLSNQLQLERDELLSTLIICLADVKTRQAVVLTVGDGLVVINGQRHVYEQDNKPDYLGFHLHENFEAWYDRQTQKIFAEHISDISIATDGIFMFQPFSRQQAATIDVIDFFTRNLAGAETEDMLYLKLKKLEHVYGLRPTDDFAMVRITI
jgi:hypothetical protein